MTLHVWRCKKPAGSFSQVQPQKAVSSASMHSVSTALFCYLCGMLACSLQACSALFSIVCRAGFQRELGIEAASRTSVQGNAGKKHSMQVACTAGLQRAKQGHSVQSKHVQPSIQSTACTAQHAQHSVQSSCSWYAERSRCAQHAES